MHCEKLENGDLVRRIAGKPGRLITEKDSDSPIWYCDCHHDTPAALLKCYGKWTYTCPRYDIGSPLDDSCGMFLYVDDVRGHETSSLPWAQQQAPETWRRENNLAYKADMTRIETQPAPVEPATVEDLPETPSVVTVDDDCDRTKLRCSLLANLELSDSGSWNTGTMDSTVILTPTATGSSVRCPEEEQQSNQAELQDELDLDKAIQMYQEAREKGKKAKEEVAVLLDKLQKAQAEADQAEKEEMMALKPVARLSQQRIIDDGGGSW